MYNHIKVAYRNYRNERSTRENRMKRHVIKGQADHRSIKRFNGEARDKAYDNEINIPRRSTSLDYSQSLTAMRNQPSNFQILNLLATDERVLTLREFAVGIHSHSECGRLRIW